MTGAIEGANKFAGIGHQTVTKWGAENDEGQRLDCYWNIAKESLGTGATDAEILAVTEELMELNCEKDNTTGEYDTTLHEGEQVLMTKQAAIQDTQEAVDDVTSNYNDAVSALSDYAGRISETMQNIASIEEQLSKFSGSDAQPLLNQLSGLQYQLYNQQQEYEAKQEEVDTLNNEMHQLQEAIALLSQEYQDEQNNIEGQKSEFQTQIDDIETAINNKTSEIKTLEQIKSETEEQIRKEKEEQGTGEIPADETGGDDKKDENTEISSSEDKEPDAVERQMAKDKQEKIQKFINDFNLSGISAGEFESFITDENISDDEFVEIMQNYNTQYGGSGTFSNLVNVYFDNDAKDVIYPKMLSRLENSYNNGNEEALNLLTQEFYNATKGMAGTNESYVDNFFDNLSDNTILNVKNNYNTVNNGEDMMKNIKDDFSFISNESKYTGKLQDIINADNAEKAQDLRAKNEAQNVKERDNTLNLLKDEGIPENSDLYTLIENDTGRFMNQNELDAYDSTGSVMSLSTPLIKKTTNTEGETIYECVIGSTKTTYDAQGNEIQELDSPFKLDFKPDEE